MRKLIFLIVIFFHFVSVGAQINTDRMFNVATNALYFKDYVLSIQYFNDIIKSKPYLEKPYLYRAFAKIELEDYVGALSDLNTLIEKNEFIHKAFYARGFVNNRLKNYEAAEKDFSKALEFSPDNTSYIIGRLESYGLQKKYNEELSDLEYLIRKIGDDNSLIIEKSRVQVLIGDTLQAFGTVDNQIKKDSLDPNLLGTRALINILLDRKDDAFIDYNRAIDLKSNNYTHYLNRGNLQYDKKDYRGAIADYNKAVELSGNDKQALFNRSLLMTEVGDYNQALADLDALVNKYPLMHEAVYQRAIINQNLGFHQKAIEDFSKIVNTYPKFAPAYFARANSYSALRRSKEAYQDMQTVLKIEEEQKKNKNKEKNNEQLDIGTKLASDESAISDWARLFEATSYDDENNITFNNNNIRGTIQNKDVKIEMRKDFVLSPYKKIDEISKIHYFFVPLNEFNKRMSGRLSLYFVNEEMPLTDALVNYHFNMINILSDSINKDSTNYDNYFLRAINFSLTQNFEDAISDFHSAIKLKDDALAYFCRANIRNKQLEVSMANVNKQDSEEKVISQKNITNDFELILRDYDKAISIENDFVLAYFNKANILTKLKDYDAAILNYTRAIDINSNIADIYFNRGLTYIYLGEKDKGIADLSKAGELGIYAAYNIIKKLRLGN